jgi:hypothetical protein
MSVRSQVKDGVYLKTLQAVYHILLTGHIAVDETKIRESLQQAGVVPGAAIVQFIEGHDPVRMLILGHEVAHQPGSANLISNVCNKSSSIGIHEALSSGHQYIPHVRERIKRAFARQNRCLSP